MNSKQYRQEIKRTMNNDLTEKEKLTMLGLGVVGEAGEIADSLKKVIFHGHEFSREEFVKELGDLDWYVTHLKEHFGITDEEVWVKNIEKLQKRYSKGFSEEDSINRKD